MLLSAFQDLSNEEKAVLLQTVDKLKDNLNSLVHKFYLIFLSSDDSILQLFKETDMVKQHNMFNASIAVILTNIEHPDFLEEHLDEIIRRHSIYGVQPNHVSIFVEALTLALRDVFTNNVEAINAWTKVIHITMDYFKSKI